MKLKQICAALWLFESFNFYFRPMMFIAFLKGMLVSLAFGIPAGPIGVLTIQKTVKYGFKAGLITGLGSVIADIFYAGIGVFGVHLIQDFMLRHQRILSLCGALIILGLGIWIVMTRTRPPKTVSSTGSAAAGFLSSMAIGLSNPATILAFFVAFSTFGVAEGLGLAGSLTLLAGVVAGAVLWWTLLAAAVVKWKSRMTEKFYQNLKLCCGIGLLLFGVGIIIKAIFFT